MGSARAQLSAPERPLDNLPLELTSFIGREREVAEVKGLLGDRRLLTLCGPGGAGKTRLALAVAQDTGRRIRGRGVVGGAGPALRPESRGRGRWPRRWACPSAQDTSPTEALVEHLETARRRY